MSEQELDKLSALPLTAQEEARLESSRSLSNKESSMENLSKVDESGVHQANQPNLSIFRVAKGGSIVLVGSLFAYACQLAIGFMLTRLLGAEQFGQYKVALTTGQIACSFAFLGMDVALVRFVSLFASQRDTSGLRGTLQVGVGVSTLLGLLIGVGLYVFATPLALHVFHASLLIPLLRLAGLVVPL